MPNGKSAYPLCTVHLLIHDRCFYFFNFTVEIIVVYLFAAVRIDLLFYVPDGSKGPGDYSRPVDNTVEKQSSPQEQDRDVASGRWSSHSEAQTAVAEEEAKL